MQHPQVGKTVSPRAVTATGTSSLHGKALEQTQQQHWTCELIHAHPSISHCGPQQMQGRQGAPGLRQTSNVRQQTPIFPEHDKHAERLVSKEQLAQQRAQHRTSSSSFTASSLMMV